MKIRATVYWLVPANLERELFRELIRILAQQFEAPLFEPHLTLLVVQQDRRLRNNRGSRNHAKSPGKVLQSVNAESIRMMIRGTGSSSRFTKTLFVRFKSNKLFEKLIVDLSRATKSRIKPVRDPHVSLLYKKLPPSIKRELAATIRLPFRDVIFDSIQAVRCSLPVADRADVEGWRAVAIKRLSGERTRPRVPHSAPRRMQRERR